MNEIFFMMIFLSLKLLMKVSDSASNSILCFCIKDKVYIGIIPLYYGVVNLWISEKVVS